MSNPRALLDEVRAAADGYRVFAELGRRSDDDVWFLGRDQATARLVALRLRETTDADGTLSRSLEVAHELTEAIPMAGGLCPKCRRKLHDFARFCGKCGVDLTKVDTVPTSLQERQALLDQIRQAAGAQFDVLGEMTWQAGAIIYFALDRSTDRLVRLRLEIEGETYRLAETFSDVALNTGGLVPVIDPDAPRPAPPAEAAIRIPRTKSIPRPAVRVVAPTPRVKFWDTPNAPAARAPSGAEPDRPNPEGRPSPASPVSDRAAKGPSPRLVVLGGIAVLVVAAVVAFLVL